MTAADLPPSGDHDTTRYTGNSSTKPTEDRTLTSSHQKQHKILKVCVGVLVVWLLIVSIINALLIWRVFGVDELETARKLAAAWQEAEIEKPGYHVSDGADVVAFYATLSGGQTLTSDGQSTIIFNNVILNIEASYDSDSGVFTAPYIGLYSFSYEVQAGSCDTGHVCGELHVDGDVIARSCSQGYSGGSKTVNVQLGTGGRVWMTVAPSMDCSTLSDADGYSTFAGFLVKRTTFSRGR